ncbi:MAG TPA: hypothetical protein PKZ21_00600 [Bacteroidales bacterium]|nr:hypothetical protein [Bacteroidales bacterium]
MKKKLILLLAFISIFYLSSCKKAVEADIEGDWKKMDMNNPLSSQYEMWHIKEGAFYIVKVSSSGAQTQLYKGEYIIKNKFYLFQRLFSITSCTNQDLVRDWKIRKLTDNYLTLMSKDGVQYEYKRL